ncbi:MAG TPA: hypothetical protein PLD95_04045 [bacterium]|jgi:hypothetical protein|nr:hypothetical protein [bacterium]
MVNPCWGDYIIVKKSGKKFKLSEIKDLQLKYKNNEYYNEYKSIKIDLSSIDNLPVMCYGCAKNKTYKTECKYYKFNESVF